MNIERLAMIATSVKVSINARPYQSSVGDRVGKISPFIISPSFFIGTLFSLVSNFGFDHMLKNPRLSDIAIIPKRLVI